MTREQKLDLAVRVTASVINNAAYGPLVVLRIWNRHGPGDAACQMIREKFAQPLGRWAA